MVIFYLFVPSYFICFLSVSCFICIKISYRCVSHYRDVLYCIVSGVCVSVFLLCVSVCASILPHHYRERQNKTKPNRTDKMCLWCMYLCFSVLWYRGEGDHIMYIIRYFIYLITRRRQKYKFKNEMWTKLKYIYKTYGRISANRFLYVALRVCVWMCVGLS